MLDYVLLFFEAIFSLCSLVFLAIAIHTKKPKYDEGFFPPVSVISWGWRDGNIIARKIENFLSLNYPGKFEVIIIDNSSKDETYKVCRSYMRDGVLKCYRTEKEYDRKAFGLDEAIKKIAKYDIIAMTDPDGVCEKDWLTKMVQPFKDEKVGAVIGLTHCGNFYKNMFTKTRAVEDEWFYVISPLGRNFGNDVHLVCGANYAVRRRVLESVGYHGKKTLGEDFELTIKLYSNNWLVRVVDANVWQEEVENLGQYTRQRLRWQDTGVQSARIYAHDFLNIFKKRPLGLSLFLISFLIQILSFFYLIFMAFGILFSSFTTFLFGLIPFVITNIAIIYGLVKVERGYLIPYVPIFLFIDPFLTLSCFLILSVMKLLRKKVVWRTLFGGYYHSGSRIEMR